MQGNQNFMNKTKVRYSNVFSLASGKPSQFRERDLVRSSFLSFAELDERIKIFFAMKILKYSHTQTILI